MTSIEVTAIGGSGGTAGNGTDGAPGGTGGLAGEVVATIPVTGGAETLPVTVGCQGQDSANSATAGAAGGFGAGNGGSGGSRGSGNNAAAAGGGGGGASQVALPNGDPLVVAGGGAGGGGGGNMAAYNGGAGGEGFPGCAPRPEPNDSVPCQDGLAGVGGPEAAGGIGGDSGARAGAAGVSSSNGTNAGGGGGGGGGGFNGGSGGQSGGQGPGERGGGGGGGGAGMSFAASVDKNPVFGTGSGPGDGEVIIRWDITGLTTTSVASAPNPSQVGQTVTFTATVTPTAPGGAAPTGPVAFFDETNGGFQFLGKCQLNGANPGQCTFATAALARGTHDIGAVYGGDANYTGSTGTETQTVIAAAAAGTVSPDRIAFPAQPQNTTSSPETVSVISVGTGSLDINSLTLGGPNPQAFKVVDDTCSGVVLPPPPSLCEVGVEFTPPSAGGFEAVLDVNSDAFNSPFVVDLSGSGLPGFAYHPLTPTRIADTRTDSGLPNAGETLGPNGTLNVQVAGVDGVPSDATAVAVNVTVTNTTANSFLTVFPTDAPRPHASNLNWLPTQTTSNLVQVQLGTDGQISAFNNVGRADVIVDLQGYYAPDTGMGGLFNPVSPFRITDTRAGSGQPNAGDTIGPKGTLDIQATGIGGVPAAGVEAVVVNLTGTNPTADTFLSVFPTGSRPAQPTSNLNLLPGETRPVRVIVPVSSTGEITVFNNVGDTDVVVDINGWFTSNGNGAGGSRFVAVNPVRVVDTRGGSGEPYSGGTLHASTTLHVMIAGVKGIPLGIQAVSQNVTTTNTTGNSFLTVYPDLTARPLASDLNWLPTETNPNLTIVGMGTNGFVDFYNNVGSADLVVDVGGYYL